MSEESIKASNDLIRWLKMLALPVGVRFALASIMLLILFSALSLLVWGLHSGAHETIASAVTMLTVGLPVGLIVVALVFGDGGATKLKALTLQILTKEIPETILENLSADADDSRYSKAKITKKIRGCIADYRLTVHDKNRSNHSSADTLLTFEFKLELNVMKVNFVIWIPEPKPDSTHSVAQQLENYQSCFFGAEKEGYLQNETLLQGEKKGFLGMVFIKKLGEDFLINPAQRLYFAQDFAFFVRGLLAVEANHG